MKKKRKEGKREKKRPQKKPMHESQGPKVRSFPSNGYGPVTISLSRPTSHPPSIVKGPTGAPATTTWRTTIGKQKQRSGNVESARSCWISTRAGRVAQRERERGTEQTGVAIIDEAQQGFRGREKGKWEGKRTRRLPRRHWRWGWQGNRAL